MAFFAKCSASRIPFMTIASLVEMHLFEGLDLCYKGKLVRKRRISKEPVTNAIKILQACIHKSVNTGLFLKSIIAPHVVKFNMLMPVFTFKYQDL